MSSVPNSEDPSSSSTPDYSQHPHPLSEGSHRHHAHANHEQVSLSHVVPCPLGPNGVPFGRKMRRLSVILYSRTSFVDEVELLKLLPTMVLCLWQRLVTCPRNMASITSRFLLTIPRKMVLSSGSTSTSKNPS